jgi:hypothetical protein
VPSCFAASRHVAVIGQGTRLAIACSAFSAIAVVESGGSIHDIIKFVRSSVPIYMIGTGWVASAGALIYPSIAASPSFSSSFRPSASDSFSRGLQLRKTATRKANVTFIAFPLGEQQGVLE